MRVFHHRLLAVLLGACISSAGLATNDARAAEFIATWRQISTTNAPQWREWSAMTWSDSLNQAVLWGGAGGGSYLNDVWTFDPAAKSWTMLQQSNSCAGMTSFDRPNGSDESGVVFDPINNYFWLWNGGSGYRCGSQQVYTRSAGAGSTGTTVVDATLPATTNDYYKDWLVQKGGSATATVLSYDAALKTLVLDRDIGITAGAAYTVYADFGNGAWSYSLSTGQYTKLMARHWGYTGLEPTDHKSTGFAGDGANAYMFGGASNDNALYKLDFSTKQFTLAIPAGQGTSPEPRGQIENQFVYDAFSRQFVLFGGVCYDRQSVRCINSTYLNDTWLYDPATNSWTEVTGAVGPSARSYGQMYFDSKNGVVVLFGGVSPTGAALDDLWTFDTRTLLWTEVRVPATNPGNVSLGLTTFAPSTGCGYSVYGHSRGSAMFGIWELCLQPNTPPVAVITGPGNLSAGVFATFSASASTDAEANIKSYAWDFGDGTSAVGVSAKKVYANPGTYTVQLTVTDSLGAISTVTQQVVVSAGTFSPPTANFSVQPSAGVAGVATQFTDASSAAPNASIVSYAWDFGDGTTGTGASVAKTYQYIGKYTVTLTVTDNHGLSSVKTAPFTVGVPPGIPTNVALAANGGIATASSVYDTRYPVESINNGDRKGLNWGAGGGWNDATPSVYPDWVQIDFNGAQTIGEIDVFTLQDNRDAPAVPTLGLTFATYGITQFEVQYWDGGGWVDVDGGSVTGNDKVWRQFVFAPVSTTSIRVLVTGALNNFSRIVEVEAWTPGGVGNQAPVASISGPTSGQVGASLSFSGAGSTDAEGPIASYAWTFGDGTSATGVSAAKTYGAAGSYTVTLTVTDAGGLTNSKTQTVVITAAANQAPVAAISGPTSGQVGASLSFSGAGSTDAEGPIASYAWTFGDGTSATGVSATKTYGAAGSYTVTLTVTDAGGLTNSKTQTVVITAANQAPVAAISGPTSGQVGASLSFSGAGSTDAEGAIASYAWTFGDGTSASGVSATKTYGAAGSYTVTLTVTDAGGLTDSKTQTVVITAVTGGQAVNVAAVANGGVATASSTFDARYPASAVNNGDRLGLNWGAGGAWADATSGVYPDWVQIDFNGTQTISEIDVFTLQDNAYSPSVPTLTMTFSNYGITQFQVQYWNGTGWVDVPGGNVTGNNKVWRQFTFAPITTPRIRVLVTSSTYYLSRIAEVEAWTPGGVGNQAPVAAISGPTSGQVGASLSFSGAGSTDAEGAIASYAWTFGDGTSASGVSATKSYSAAGSYTVTLTVTDAGGLTNSKTQTVVITAANQAPVASISGPTSGQVGASLSFSGAGSTDAEGPIASYAWTFGDGTSATGVSATKSYSAAGSYTVTLTVTDAGGLTNSKTQTVVITAANQAPVAAISGPTSGQVGASLSFSGAGSTDAEGPIASYAWTFGDGTSATGVSATKSYSAAGSYTVTLTVTDAGGLTNSKTQTVVITAANQAPVAAISGPTSGQVGASLSFSGAGSTDAEGPIASYAWTFGDGTSASGVSATKTYSAAGSYTVTLTVTDAGGLTNSKTQTVVITAAANQAPVAAISGPTSGQVGASLSFSGAGSTDAEGPIASYAWTFGDGTSATGVSATKSYSAAGSYTVTLTVTDAGGLTDSKTQTVVITAVTGGQAVNVAAAANGGVATASSSFDARYPASAVIDGDRLGLKWGAGGAWADATSGVYPDWVQIDFNGTQTISEIDVFTLQDNAYSPSVPTLTMTFSNYGITQFQVQYWNGAGWADVPGGNVTGNNKVWRQFTFAPITTPRIRVLVTSSTYYLSRIAEVEAWTPGGVGNQAPVAAISGPTSGQVGASLSFSGAGSTDAEGPIASYAWTFGDGTSASGVSATKSYSAAGSYTVTLTVTDAGGLTNSKTQTVVITAANQAPVAAISGPTSGQVGASLSFSGAGSTDAEGPIASYAWTFGDGTSATGVSATKSYSAAGSYTVTLTVTDAGGLTNSKTQTVVITAANQAPVAAISGPTSGQVGASLSFSGAGSTDAEGPIASYAWTFGDGTSATGVSATKSYSAAGSYTVTLTVTDAGGLTNSKTQTVVITAANQAPVASISGPTSGQVGASLSFSGAGSTDAEGPIASYAWTFGDGTSASGVSATKSYSAAGSYTVTLTVTDAGGLTNSKTQTVVITAANQAPVASISGPTSGQVGASLSFSGAGSTDAEGPIASYAWTFGDGTSASGVSATKTYGAAGSYTVTLTVTDAGGLTNSRTQTVVITAVTGGQAVNVAAAANGGVATASSTFDARYPASAVNNGDRLGLNWGAGGAWADATSGVYPDWVQIDFNGTQTISEIDVFTLQDNAYSPSVPTLTMTFSNYGITQFQVQYWNGTGWADVPGGNVVGNNKVWRQFTFAPITTPRIRVLVTSSTYYLSRIAEVEAWTASQ